MGVDRPRLYAAGEVAGFGGSGVHGYNALEGTFWAAVCFSRPGRRPACRNDGHEQGSPVSRNARQDARQNPGGTHVSGDGRGERLASSPSQQRRTGDVSNAYPNLFTQLGCTFIIWGVIYLLLGAPLSASCSGDRDGHPALLSRVGVLFSIPRW